MRDTMVLCGERESASCGRLVEMSAMKRIRGGGRQEQEEVEVTRFDLL